MGRAERIVFAFRTSGESRQAPALAQRANAVAPAGKYLVRIGLMPTSQSRRSRGVSNR
jgi:hypothetical protein